MTRPRSLMHGGMAAAEPRLDVAMAGGWSSAGSVPYAASWAQEGAVLLPGGSRKVLVAGGEDGRRTALNSSALYDPGTNTWKTTLKQMSVGRRLHTTTLLKDGRVLVVGGSTGNASSPTTGLASAEIFNPADESWSPTGSMREPRFSHSATLLPSGKVLVAGGGTVRSAQSNRSLRTAELWDPGNGRWTPAADMTDARLGHRAMLVRKDNKDLVLVVGGLIPVGRGRYNAIALCELFDPDPAPTGKWSITGSLALPRKSHQATLLADGAVLVTGGDSVGMDDWTYNPYSLTTIERYNPASGVWTTEGEMDWGRSHHRAVLLPGGKLLVIGGTDDASFDVGYQNSAVYDLAAKTWSVIGMTVGRWAFAATALADGRVLAVGGISQSGAASPDRAADVITATAEVFTP